MQQIVIIFVSFLLVTGCAIQEHDAKAVKSACHIIFDAGSSGTRLYIYQYAATRWIKHSGPEKAALADPIRRNAQGNRSRVGEVTDSIVEALEEMRHDGPEDRYGNPKWPAFDWTSKCRLDSVAVYATAGMRIAQRLHPVAVEQLWAMLNRKLSAAAGMIVSTRTLSGFEEGLYAWLATREGQPDSHFAIVEMGGASVQISFPCVSCRASRELLTKGIDVALASYSFLGLGQDEAWKVYARRPACQSGVGLRNRNWQIEDCSDAVELPEAIGSVIREISGEADIHRWYLAGAFRYSKPSDIDDYCRHDVDSGYKPLSACFRAVYQQHFLTTLGVPLSAEHSDADWTLGAVICTVNACLSKASPE